MSFVCAISQLIKMSFKQQECQVRNCAPGASFYCPSAYRCLCDPPQTEDIAQKVKNSICLLLEVCDSEDLQKSTKFLAYSIFLRYLSKQACTTEEEFTTLILCSLRLASKFNEALPKSLIFDHKDYSDLLLPNKSMSEILQFQMSLFTGIGCRIFIKTPYDFLNELAYGRNLSLSFFSSVTAFLDFSLTLVEMVVYSPEEIFAGCLVALKKSRNLENKKILGLIEEICGNVTKANQAGYNILQSWQNIMNQNVDPAQSH